MRLKTRFGQRYFPLVLAGILAAGFIATAPRIARAKVPQASPAAAESQASQVRLERILLLLEPSVQQQSDLDALVAAQSTPGNASFHKWLTPAEYAARFANTPSDTAKVAAWLTSQGFIVARLPASRAWIEFSGTRTQVESAFHVHVTAAGTADGMPRFQIKEPINPPATIAAFVKGLASLDGALSASAATPPVALRGDPQSLAADTSPAQAEALTPSLAAKLLKLEGLQTSSAPLTGAGQSIAIPARTTVRAEDLAAFRQAFGLSNAGQFEVNTSAAGPESNTGRNEEEAATLLAASWAAAIAPAARIVLVPANSTNSTDGVDLALAAIIDGDLAHTVSIGYSTCEAEMSAAHQAFYAALYRQAAAEGISVVAATGDSGAAACHVAGAATLVSTGFQVNGLASTPWNTAVGAAALSSENLSGWGQLTASDPAFATGGGSSTLYPTPKWQSAQGLPASDPATAASHHRYLPDVALPAAIGNSANRGLAYCFSADSGVSGCRLVSSGGSAASAAVFSGVSALLAQKFGPQGNLAPNLYAISRSQSSSPALVDISEGSARLACVIGSPNCTDSGEYAGQIGFSAAAGYDLATGLGSVNVKALVDAWAAPQATGTLKESVEMTTIGGITYNPSALIALTAKVVSISGGAVPTGTIQFYDDTNLQDTGSPVTLASDGTASYAEQGQFTVGGHNIEAIYSGDNNYEPGTSQPVTINIQPSPTSLIVKPSTTTPAGGAIITVTGTVTATNPGADPPSGSLTVNLDGLPQGTAKFATINSATTASVQVTVPAAGSHTVQGTYSGDSNYNQSTSPSVTIAIAKESTTTSIAATPSTLTAGTPETFTAIIAPAVTSTTGYPITGTVSFYDGGTTLLGAAIISNNTALLPGILLSASAVHTITAVYSGDTNWTPSTSSPLLLEPVLLPVTVTLTTSTSILAPGQSASLNATVTPVSTPSATAEQHPTGNVFFYSGAKLIGEAAVASGIGDSAVASLSIPSLAAGQYVITATYQGDLTYGPATSNSIDLRVEDFTVGSTVTNINMVQGTTAQVPFLVSSVGGLTGPIQILCAEQNPPAAGTISCIFSPAIVNGTGQTSLTVITTAGNISQDQPHHKPGSPLWPGAGGGVALAFVGLLLSPIGKRARILRNAATRNFLVFTILLAGLAGAGMGCSSSSTPTGGGGTPLGVHTLKITAAAYVNNVTVSHNAFLTVNVEP